MTMLSDRFPNTGAPSRWLQGPGALDAKDLAVPPEPAQLRDQYRRLALESPVAWRQMATHGRWMAEVLWPHWTTVLTQAGVSRERLAAIASGYQLELWLWLMGERTWVHTASGLAGRVRRRAVPTAPPPGRSAAAPPPGRPLPEPPAEGEPWP